jgi:excisionase family DNA binding protein
MKLVSVGEAARRLGVTVDVVRSLADSGELRPARTAGGHRRFDQADVDALKARWASHKRHPRHSQHVPQRTLTVKRLAQVPTRTTLLDPDVWDISDDPYERQVAWQAEEARLAAERKVRDDAAAAEERRLDEYREHAEARLLGVFDVPPPVKAQALVEVRQWITSTRIPKGLSEWAARELVENQIKILLKTHYDAVAREKAKQEDAREVDALIRQGNHQAWMETFNWDSDERDAARRDVERELRLQVEATWTPGDVRELVEDVLFGDSEEGGEEGEEGHD